MTSYHHTERLAILTQGDHEPTPAELAMADSDVARFEAESRCERAAGRCGAVILIPRDQDFPGLAETVAKHGAQQCDRCTPAQQAEFR